MLVVRKTKRYMTFLSLVLVFVVILSTEARAVMYGSWMVVENNSGIAGNIAAQLSVEVTDPGNDQVLFTFYNDGPLASSITDIYFDDGSLFEIAYIIDDPFNATNPVSFSKFAKPGNLPGWETVDPDFETTEGFSADSDPSVQPNGVNPGESVGIVFDLQSGYDFDGVIAAIELGFTYPLDSSWYDESLRIGIRLQGTGEGEEFSDVLVSTPVPGAVVLGILGLGVAGLKLRKFA